MMYVAILVIAVLLMVLVFMVSSGTEAINLFGGGEAAPEGLDVFKTTQDAGGTPPELPSDLPGFPSS